MSSGKVPTKVYVGNLPESCRSQELRKMFDKFGEVVECDVVKNYGFVHFANMSNAKQASDALNGSDYEGYSLKVEISHSKVRQKPGMGGKGECYRCGKEGHWSKDCPRGPGPKSAPPYASREPYPRSPYASDPYYAYRERYAPPPPMERYRPYPEVYERRPAPRDPYYSRERSGDPYQRPPPEYYGHSRRSPAREAYYDAYYDRPSYEAASWQDSYSAPASSWGDSYSMPLPPGTQQSRMSPSRSRVTAPY